MESASDDTIIVPPPVVEPTSIDCADLVRSGPERAPLVCACPQPTRSRFAASCSARFAFRIARRAHRLTSYRNCCESLSWSFCRARAARDMMPRFGAARGALRPARKLHSRP